MSFWEGFLEEGASDCAWAQGWGPHPTGPARTTPSLAAGHRPPSQEETPGVGGVGWRQLGQGALGRNLIGAYRSGLCLRPAPQGILGA